MAQRSRGTEIRIGDGGSPESFTKIPGALDIQDIDAAETNFVDTTSHDTPVSTNERTATFIDEGQVSFELFWDPEDPTQDHASGIEFDRRNLTERNFQIKLKGFTTNNQLTFPAVVQSFTKQGPVNGLYRANVVLQKTGGTTVATE